MKTYATFCVMILIILAGCNAGSDDPDAVLRKFFTAVTEKNVEAAKTYVTEDSEMMINMMQLGMQKGGSKTDSIFSYAKENLEIGTAKIDGDKALVPVKDKRSGETTEFSLKKESGSWKVAFDMSTLMQMVSKKMQEHGVGRLHNSRGDSLKLDHQTMMDLDSIGRETMKRMREIPDSDEN